MNQSGERTMNSGSVKVLLTSGRTLSQGRAMEKGKITSDYEDAVAVC
jgi:formylmethanofuran dehydrogenase subunit D